ncbi:MAG: DUF5683 domain-containing protein [Ignavibacteria bacterium]|nr:DUF5683 domain-containing protein [Ignavibacteria bacterium]
MKAWIRRLLVPGLMMVLATLACGVQVHAGLPDELSAEDSLAYQSLPHNNDSLLIAGETTRPGTLRMSKSPGLAVGLSAILPGAGQFYNESYWKIPIVVGLGGYFVAEWIRNDNLAEDFRNQYEESKTEEDPDGNSSLLATRDFYKNQRDAFVWYFVILYLANMVDAYVDANLYDFDVGEDLSLRLAPQVSLGTEYSVGLGVKLEF